MWFRLLLTGTVTLYLEKKDCFDIRLLLTGTVSYILKKKSCSDIELLLTMLYLEKKVILIFTRLLPVWSMMISYRSSQWWMILAI
jgi:hypothetical protein